MSKKIMILGASILQLPAIEEAKKMGLEVVVVDMNPEAIGFHVPGVVKEVISTIDTDAILEAARQHNIDGIMTLATDMPMRTVAIVAQQMNLVGIDSETAIKATNKAEMRVALQKAGVPIPQFFRVASEEEYKEAVKQFTAPFIVKPADSSGSRGIFAVADITNDALIREAYLYSYSYSQSREVVVEEYMEGNEVSVETISFDGVCRVIQITDKLTTGAPHYVEIGHSQPTSLDEKTVEKIIEVAKAANSAIGIKSGPSHTEIIVTKEGPKVVELGARLGGDNINTHLVPLSTGINIVKCCIEIALGIKPNIEPQFNKGAAIRYFKQKAGVIKSIEGIGRAEKLKGVRQVSVVHNVGERVTDIINSGSRMGFVITQSENAEKAIAVAERALAVLNVEIEC